MEHKSSLPENNVIYYLRGLMASGRYLNFSSVQMGDPIHGDNPAQTNRSSSLCQMDSGLPESLSEPKQNHSPRSNTMHDEDDAKEPTWDESHRRNSQRTLIDCVESITNSYLAGLCSSFSCNSSLSTIVKLLMVGAGLHSPPRRDDIPKVVVAAQSGGELRLLPLSPPKSPARTLRESIERIKAFPKIPKRQFTTPEMSPEKAGRLHVSPEGGGDVPCCGFRLTLRSPSSVPRDPFTIPEKFDHVATPSSVSLEEISKVPEVCLFPSLIAASNEKSPSTRLHHASRSLEKAFEQSRETEQPLGDPSLDSESSAQQPLLDEGGGHPTSERDSHLQLASSSVVAADNWSSWSENDIPPKGTPPHDAAHDRQRETELAREAMKEFDRINAQYNHFLENRLPKELHKMEKFVDRVRKSTVSVSEVGAMMSLMYIPYEVTASLARINRMIFRLKAAQKKIADSCKYSQWVYRNLKSKISSLQQQGTSCLDDVKELKTITKELRDLLAEAKESMDSYQSDKKYVENHVFEKGRGGLYR